MGPVNAERRVGLPHDPLFADVEDGLLGGVADVAGGLVLSHEGLAEQDGLAGEGVGDLGGFTGEAGDEEAEPLDVGGGRFPEDDAVFGEVLSLKDIADDGDGAFEQAITEHAVDGVVDDGGHGAVGAEDVALTGEDGNFGDKQSVGAGVVGDGVRQVPVEAGVVFEWELHADEGGIADLDVELPLGGHEGGLREGAGRAGDEEDAEQREGDGGGNDG